MSLRNTVWKYEVEIQHCSSHNKIHLFYLVTSESTHFLHNLKKSIKKIKLLTSEKRPVNEKILQDQELGANKYCNLYLLPHESNTRIIHTFKWCTVIAGLNIMYTGLVTFTCLYGSRGPHVRWAQHIYYIHGLPLDETKYLIDFSSDSLILCNILIPLLQSKTLVHKQWTPPGQGSRNK